MSIRTKTTDRRRPGHWLAAGALLFAGNAVHGEPAASLMKPHTSPVIVRASAEEVIPLDPLPQVVKARERPPGFKYPTPYTKEESGGFSISGLWDRIAGKGSEVQPAAKPTVAPKERTTLAHGGHNAVVAPVPGPGKGVAPAGPVTAPVVPPPSRIEAPAWRWFGYGAPVPGANPYAPAGVYAPVNPAFYYQTGSTPGAIPQPLLPIFPVVPESPTLPAPTPIKGPTSAEPPALMLKPLPSNLDEHPLVQPASAEPAPASLELPVPSSRPDAVDSISPLSSRPTTPVARGRAPEPAVTPAVVDALGRACTGFAERVDVEPLPDGKLLVKAKLLPRVVADQLAERLAAQPELAEFQLQMQFVR